jgi:hypothetical protein
MVAIHDPAIVATFHIVDDERDDAEDAGDGAQQMQDVRRDRETVALL